MPSLQWTYAPVRQGLCRQRPEARSPCEPHIMFESGSGEATSAAPSAQRTSRLGPRSSFRLGGSARRGWTGESLPLSAREHDWGRRLVPSVGFYPVNKVIGGKLQPAASRSAGTTGDTFSIMMVRAAVTTATLTAVATVLASATAVATISTRSRGTRCRKSVSSRSSCPRKLLQERRLKMAVARAPCRALRQAQLRRHGWQ